MSGISKQRRACINLKRNDKDHEKGRANLVMMNCNDEFVQPDFSGQWAPISLVVVAETIPLKLRANSVNIAL
jgi:hypothetical protein